MPKYDAFGREIGEDTLAEQGWRASEDAPAPPIEVHQHEVPQVDIPQVQIGEPPPFAAPPPPPPPAALVMTSMPQSPIIAPPTGITVTRRRRRFRGLRLLIFLGFLGWIVFRVFDGSDEIRQAVKDVQDAFPTAVSPEAPAAVEPDQPATGLNSASLIRGRNFGPALTALRREVDGQLVFLVIRPDRIDAQVRHGARTSIAQVKPGPAVNVITTVPSGGQRPIAFSKIRASSPERLTRIAARRLNVRPSRVDYVVLQDFTDGLRWITYFKGGKYAIGDAAGNFVSAP